MAAVDLPRTIVPLRTRWIVEILARRFPEVLLQFDDTGIAPNPLREVTSLVPARDGGRSESRVPSFNLQVGADGLVGLTRLP